MAKKGQAVMDFLMTYGWAILVVIIAIGALAYFGVLNPNKFLQKGCIVGEDFACESKVTASGTQLLLRNLKGETLSGVSVVVSSCATSSASADGDDIWEDGKILGGESGITLTGCPETWTSGKSAESEITLSYKSLNDALNVLKGTLSTTVK